MTNDIDWSFLREMARRARMSWNMRELKQVRIFNYVKSVLVPDYVEHPDYTFEKEFLNLLFTYTISSQKGEVKQRHAEWDALYLMHHVFMKYNMHAHYVIMQHMDQTYRVGDDRWTVPPSEFAQQVLDQLTYVWEYDDTPLRINDIERFGEYITLVKGNLVQISYTGDHSVFDGIEYVFQKKDQVKFEISNHKYYMR